MAWLPLIVFCALSLALVALADAFGYAPSITTIALSMLFAGSVQAIVRPGNLERVTSIEDSKRARSLAHDLRTQISIVSLLIGRDGAKLGPEVEVELQAVAQGIDELAALVRND